MNDKNAHHYTVTHTRTDRAHRRAQHVRHEGYLFLISIVLLTMLLSVLYIIHTAHEWCCVFIVGCDNAQVNSNVWRGQKKYFQMVYSIICRQCFFLEFSRSFVLSFTFVFCHRLISYSLCGFDNYRILCMDSGNGWRKGLND